MLFSIALILMSGMALGWLCQKCQLPGLIGILLAGVVLGPYAFNLIDASILSISPDIRKMALVIILTRAGLSLDLSSFKKIGKHTILMCFVPASFELIGMILLAPKFLGLSLLEAAIMGAVLAAVSPAVVVPRMLKLMEQGYGTRKGIPQLILAGASVDDVYVIVLFTTFIGLIQGHEASAIPFLNLPLSIVFGAILGLFVGWMLSRYFKAVQTDNTVKALIVLSLSFFLTTAEDSLQSPISFSALIAIMFMGIALHRYQKETAVQLSQKYHTLWRVAEIFLFVLVGASVNLHYLGNLGASALLVIAGALIFRMIGVWICLIGMDLSLKERLFTMMAYSPKATVQAAIGGIPLSLGLKCGDMVLTVAVLAIILTAPLGAFAIDWSYKKCLEK